MPFNNQSDDEDDLYDSVAAMADRMGLKGEKRATYIDDHMQQGGYQRVQSRESYARVRDDEDDDRGGDGNRWGFGGGGRSGGRSRSSRGSSRDDDQF